MPAAGTYKKEIDLSVYVEIASELKVGIVGPFMKGDIDERNLVTNLAQLETDYGPAPIDDATLSQAFLAGREYLRNGNQLYITRIEAAANPAVASKISLRGASDENLATGTDGATSIPATRTLTSALGDFVNDGVLAGDILEVHGGGADDGFYALVTVAATVLTIDRDWPTGSLSAQDFTVWTNKVESGTDGATGVQAGRTLTSAGSTFLTNGVQAGDILYINDTGDEDDNGFYTIVSVTATTVVVNRDWPTGELTGLTFTIYGANHPAGTDGSTATDGEFLSATAKFQDHGVKAGDLLIIEDSVDTGDNGTYLITGLKTASEDTTLTVHNAAWTTGSLTSLSFRVVPGVITLTGLSEGTWLDGYTAKASPNSNDGEKFDLEILDALNLSLETAFTLDLTNVVSELASNSTLVEAEVITNRIGPATSQEQLFHGGDNGTTGIVDADILGSSTAKTGLQSFRNIEEVEIDLLLVPGYTSQNIGDGLKNMCEQVRGDCMFIVDPPDSPTITTPQDVVDWTNGTGGFGRTTALSSSYGAVYWPWVQIYDPYYDENRWTAPSGHAASVWAQSENQTKAWFPPAGIRRGKVTGAIDIRMSPDVGQRALMQVGQNVNPFVKFITEGVVVYGQKTLYRTSSALDRVHVRRMMLYTQRATLQTTRDLVFDPNDDTTDREFVRRNTPIYEFVRDNRGLNDFLILADDSTSPPAVREQNKMIAKIYVKPTPAAEVIEVQFILTPQSADFTELAAA